MGIVASVARAILQEHRYKPITGDGLLIGRQTIPLSIEEARQMLRDEGVPERSDFDPNAPWVSDTTTRSAKGENYISDLGFFALFSDVKLRTLDVSDYEGAEIVHDMHKPVPEELHGAFDFIWNGSCLDNIFDPGMAMRSTARMLRDTGRVFCMEMATPHFEAYVTFSQAWFFDYFAINGFADCKVYTLAFKPSEIFRGDYHLFRARSFESASRQFPLKIFGGFTNQNYARLTLAIAEAAPGFTTDLMPIQSHYRPENPAYERAYARFDNSERPVIRGKSAFSSWAVRKSRSAEYLGVLRGAN